MDGGVDKGAVVMEGRWSSSTLSQPLLEDAPIRQRPTPLLVKATICCLAICCLGLGLALALSDTGKGCSSPTTPSTSTPITGDPPPLPKEYSYRLSQHYKAVCSQESCKGVVTNSQRIVGMQYWSFEQQSQRGVIASAQGVDQCAGTPVLNHLSVTNYSDTGPEGSLVTDMVRRTCSYTANEGGASYAGYDFYTNQIKSLRAAGVRVNQYQVANWEYEGVSYGAVDIWEAIPPQEPSRNLTYRIIYRAGSNLMLSYQSTGREQLPCNGTAVNVTLDSTSINTEYTITQASAWPAVFFSTTAACFFL